MPGYQGHLVGGLVAGNLLLATLTCIGIVQPTPFGCVEWLLVCLLGALFPDIDIKSKGQKVFYWMLLLVYVYLFIQKHLQVLGILSIVGISPMLVKHRGLFHSGWFIAGMSFTLCIIACHYYPYYKSMILINTLFFVFGAFSHLVLDLGFKKTFRL